MSNIIYTVGHSTMPVDDFIKLIKMHDIDCIVDVRSTPYSQYAPQFNQAEIIYALKKAGVAYIYMGKELGARRDDATLYDEDGRLNFEKTAASPSFKSGIDRIMQGIKKGYTIALMCTEKDPMDCHRCILVGRKINNLENCYVENILSDGSLLKQTQVEEKLLEIYHTNRDQLTITELLSGKQKSEEEYLNDAYRKKAKEIAYQI